MPKLKKHEREKLLTYEQVAEILSYDPITGKLYWKVATGRVTIGTRAGCKRLKGKNDHRLIRIFGYKIYEHRVAWLLYYGNWPEGDLDHKNRKKFDNRIKNLRRATHSQNQSNRLKQKNNSTGFKGVSRHSDGKRFMISGSKGKVSTYSLAEAVRLYNRRAKIKWGKFSILNEAYLGKDKLPNSIRNFWKSLRSSHA